MESEIRKFHKFANKIERYSSHDQIFDQHRLNVNESKKTFLNNHIYSLIIKNILKMSPVHESLTPQL